MSRRPRYLSITAIILILAVNLVPSAACAQDITRHIVLDWHGIRQVERNDAGNVYALTFEGAVHTSPNSFAPLYHKVIPLPSSVAGAVAAIRNAHYEPVSAKDAAGFTCPVPVADTLSVRTETGIVRGKASLDIQFIPLIRTGETLSRLVSFDLDITFGEKVPVWKSAGYAAASVLASGDWYRVRVNKTGICKVTYSDLQDMGVDMSRVTPSGIRLFGKPGGMLPESNSVFRYDDLPENAIQVVTATEGVFAPGDYFLFYATAPNSVVFNSSTKKFEHRQNYYSDYTYYFLNFDGSNGKRILIQPQSTGVPQYACTTFLDFSYYENDLYNLIKSGKQWIGERLDFNNATFTLPAFHFTNVETVRQAWVRYRVVARASASSNFSITANSNSLVSRTLAAYTTDSFTQEAIETKTFAPVEGDQVISFRYNTPNSTALGYIDYVEVNVPRRLEFTGGQMVFADPVTVISGAVTQFRMTSAVPSFTLWEVTNPVDVHEIVTVPDGDFQTFTMNTDSLRRFVAFDASAFNKVEFVEKVANQNLHGITSAEMLIVTHPDFLAQANRLADHHRIQDGMTVTVATNQQIYNEFSSGSPDVSAIRDFARMLYLKPDEGGKLRYLLLFGDGSYDYKDHLPVNTNYVLAFQTQESQNLIFSTASDDFFALFDPTEGNDASGKLDIGVGRFPVDNAEQAEDMVDKCIFYATGVPDNLGEWRNALCFIADDEDSNTHIRQVEDQLTPGIEEKHPIYNINKVYLDAYQQISTSGGARYPEVNSRINELVQNGVLIMNYTGHGGETGWATESILTLNDINSWTNFTHMPVFVTATCEFSRFDDPGRVSAGEQTFLNPSGGGVALFTTTRLANAGNNIELTIDLYDTIFSIVNGNFPRFGDIIAYAKNQNSSVSMIRNFMLLGDPALHLAYPRYNVVTTSINGHGMDAGADTITAMSDVEVEGMITDPSGNLVSSFNGIVAVKVYDKYKWMMTRGNDATSPKRYFDVQENVLYQGKATVKDGLFNFRFIVPRDIDFSYGKGKISYYAYSETVDAAGYSDSITIGGSNDGPITDLAGPAITLYMNDERFRNGGITGPNPMLLAYLSDESGLNTVGNGIGHDLVATLDGNSAGSIVLNEFYQADLDSYKSGKLLYNFSGLSAGKHTLTLKAWDVFNNSSEATIEFTVKENIALQVLNITAWPNPFTDEVKLSFEHNLFNDAIEVEMDIISLQGELIGTLSPETYYSNGYLAGTVTWDGRNRNGAEVNDGIYLLRIRATNGKTSAEKSIRVVKIRN